MATQISASTRRKVSRVISHHRAMVARLFIALWGRVADAVRVLIPVVLPDMPRLSLYRASATGSSEVGCANSITSNALSACVDACGLPDAALSKGFPRTFSDTQQKIARVHESQDGSRFC